MENNDEFEFLGMPSNDPIEVPDKPVPKAKKKPKSPLDGMSVDDFKNMIPPEMMEQLKSEAESLGLDLDESLKRSLEFMQSGKDPADLLKEATDQLAEAMNGFNPTGQTSQSQGLLEYDISSTTHLIPSMFGSIPCVRTNTLYEQFVEKYGADSSVYFGENGVKGYYSTNITTRLPMNKIIGAKLIASNDIFITFHTLMADSLYGFFIVVFKNLDGDFEAFVPEFRNTFKYNEETDVVSCFNLNKDDSPNDLLYFHQKEDGEYEFNLYSAEAMDFAARCWLAPENKRIILNPHQFGTIKNIMPVIKDSTNILKIANITSCESEDAILLKKDADLPLEETVFPLYVNFGYQISKVSLQEIAQLFFKVDWNNCKLLDYTELRFDSGALYIDMDLGEF